MEASSICNCNSIVPQALNDSNYEIWSSCMEDYLSIQDLWEVIIEAEPEETEESKNEIKIWRKKNLMALHAIKMSCGPNFISKVVKLKSAKEAWDLLAAAAAEGQSADEDDEEEEEKEENDTTEEVIDYDPFIKDVRDGDWESIEKFIDAHPQAVTAKVFYEDNTVLHFLLNDGRDKVAALLVNRMTVNDMEILNETGNTPLAVGAQKRYPNRLQTLELMVSKHPNLPNIGSPVRLPVSVAAWNGYKETTRFLYSVTNKNIFNPESGTHGVELLVNCIESKIFDVASKLVHEFPNILWQSNDSKIWPTEALATTFCVLFSHESGYKKSSRDNKLSKESNDEELTRAQARDFLRLVCSHVSTLSMETLVDSVYGAMVEAATHGNIEFINEMLSAHSELISAFKGSDGIFDCAVKNRRHKIFNLIYPVIEQKDELLSTDNEEDNNMLHFAAMVAPPHILDRTSGPALQVQTELQWFKEVWNVVDPRERERLNNEKLTPRQLFTKTHEKLIDAGEKSMKDTAQSSTVVGALIVTIMFAAAFTVPGGNNQDGYPLFVNDVLFKIFIVCDALSLFSSATSVLIFLGILTSRYAEDDFLLLLPRKLMLGISTLFFSIATMMVTFCAALAIMLNGRLQFIFPIVLLAFVPVILFLSSIFPLLSKIYKSTFGPSIFDKNTKLPSKKEYKKIMSNPSSGTEFPSKNLEGESLNNHSSSVAEELPTNKKEDKEIVNASSVDNLV